MTNQRCPVPGFRVPTCNGSTLISSAPPAAPMDGSGRHRRLRQVLGTRATRRPGLQFGGAEPGRAGNHTTRRGLSVGFRAAAVGIHPFTRLRRAAMREHQPRASAARHPTGKRASSGCPWTFTWTQTGNGGCSRAGRSVPCHPGRHPQSDPRGPASPARLAQVLAEVIAEGFPMVDVVPLFEEPPHVPIAAIDDFPPDLFAVPLLTPAWA